LEPSKANGGGEVNLLKTIWHNALFPSLISQQASASNLGAVESRDNLLLLLRLRLFLGD
jgi:hypothetical protein